MKIKLSDISEKPCDKYYDYIVEAYGADGKFDPIEVFSTVPGGASYGDVQWLMRRCEKSQKPEILEYYKSKKPYYGNVSTMMVYCEYVRTTEMLEYYMSLNPTYTDANWLMHECEFARTPEMLEYVNKLKQGKTE